MQEPQVNHAARDAIVSTLNSWLEAHVAHRHQILVLSGAVAGAAVSAEPSGVVLLGLSLLSTAFAFAMLNHHHHILVIAGYMTTLEDSHGAEHRAWLEYLRQRRAEPPGAWLYAAAAYAVPGLSAVGALVAFVYGDGRDLLALLPAAALLFFLIEAVRIRRRFITLGARRG